MQSFSYRSFLATTALCCLPTLSAHAAPMGGVVSAGDALIGQAGSITTIAQGSDRAAIDWQSFNIGANESVVFQQPSSSAITLNRIHDQNPSQILGSIKANGQVILSNPSGMIFGKNSKIDVGGLVATTANIGNDAFMQGGPLKLTIPGKADAKIVANGSITANDAGLVALLAPNVENNGVITAKLGKVQLAGAETATVDLYGDGLVSLAVTNATETSVTHTGTIQAQYVALTAADASQLIDSTVNVNGIIDANDARTNNDGTLTFGGKIEVTARDVTLESKARLRATGKDGGGIVKVGGGWQGKGTISNAKNTTVKAGARINASATNNGDGGTVAVWSDDTTQFDGTILAKGGPIGGNGGHVETSGKINLGLTGSADASSAWGTPGEWLLDPRNVIIQNNAVAGVENNVPAGGGVVNAPSDTYRISAESIGVALSAGNNVTITTGTTGTQDGNITFNTATISSSSNSDVTLTLKADNAINKTGGAISITGGASGGTGKLHTVFWPDADNSGQGGINLSGLTITTHGGDVIMAGGADDGANILDHQNNILFDGTASDGRPDNYIIAGPLTSTSGIAIGSGSTITTGNGMLLMRGKGRTDDATSGSAYGVILTTAAVNTGDGNAILDGVSGNGTNVNMGVDLTTGTSVTARDGNVILTGRSVGTRGTASSYGIYMGLSSSGVSSYIDVTGTGSVFMLGYGGGHSTTAINNAGIALHVGAGVKTVSGNIDMTGYGGTGSQGRNAGIYFTGATEHSITQTDTGTITIHGYGGNVGESNPGIWFRGSNSILANGNGNVHITAEKGANSSLDIDWISGNFEALTTISAGMGSGQVNLTADSLIVPNLYLQGADVQIEPRSPGTDIGVAGGPGTLAITSSILENTTAGNLKIGRSDGYGLISVGQYAWDDPVEFITNAPGMIQLSGPQTAQPGSDATMTFTGHARTYYDIDMSAGAGTVTFNGSRETKTGGGGSGGGGGSPVNPVPVDPLPENPGTPAAPPSANPGSPSVPALPANHSANRTLFSAVVSQDTNAREQVLESVFDFGGFNAYNLEYRVDALYHIDPELEKILK